MSRPGWQVRSQKWLEKSLSISSFQVNFISPMILMRYLRFTYICAGMEEWQLEFEWLRVRHWIKDRFGRKELPDMNAVLFLIGMQELGKKQTVFSKEEKQDLMHVAICHLLAEDGYFEFEGIDADGWPHWKPLMPLDVRGVAAQEMMLRRKVIEYFAPLLSENEIS